MKRSAFTLIELMVVILVIALIAAMVFRMVALVGQNNDKAATRATLEKVGHALEEFKAQYGKYPPVPSYPGPDGKPYQPMCYEFPDRSSRGWGDDPERTARQFLNYEKTNGTIQWGNGGQNRGVFYTFGLVSFFLPRYNGTASRGPRLLTGLGKTGQGSKDSLVQWRDYNKKVSNKVGDSAKDLNACRKILPYLGGGIDENGNIDYGLIDHWNVSGARTLNCDLVQIVVTNACPTIKDAWERELRYVSRPPYESYTLSSAGPDGSFGTDDDIVAGVE